MSAAERIGELDRLIHEPARLQILAQLYVVESADFTFLLRQLGLTNGNLSSHLSKLEKANYVDAQKEIVGKRPRTLVSLTAAGREAFQQYRQRMRSVLDELPE